MTDEQFNQLLTALQPKEKPWLQKMAENMAVTIFTGALTACLFLGWHMYTDMDGRVDKLEDEQSASTTVFTEGIAQVSTKADSIPRIWEQIQALQKQINELEKDHIENRGAPRPQPSPVTGSGPVSPSVVPPPKPAPEPNVQQTAPGLVSPDELFKGLEAEESKLRWKLNEQRKK